MNKGILTHLIVIEDSRFGRNDKIKAFKLTWSSSILQLIHLCLNVHSLLHCQLSIALVDRCDFSK